MENTAARTTVIATIKMTAITGETACSSFTILRFIVVSSDQSQKFNTLMTAYIPYVKRSLRKTIAPMTVRMTVKLAPVQAIDKAHCGTPGSLCASISGGLKTEL